MKIDKVILKINNLAQKTQDQNKCRPQLYKLRVFQCPENTLFSDHLFMQLTFIKYLPGIGRKMNELSSLLMELQTNDFCSPYSNETHNSLLLKLLLG